MQRRQSTIRIILMLSLILHLSLFLNMRGTILSSHIYRNYDSVKADIVKASEPSVIPPADFQPPKIDFKPQTSKRDVNNTKTPDRPLPRSAPDRSIAGELPQRAMVTRLPKQDNAEILTLDINKPTRESLSGISTSNERAMGASVKGRAGEGLSGRGPGGGGAGSIGSILDRETIRRELPVSDKLQIYKPEEIPYIKAFKDISDHITNTSKSRKADIAFVIDTSESMKDEINAVIRHLNLMIDTFQKTGLDFTLGVVRFNHTPVYEWLGMDIVISKQTTNVEEIRNILKSIRVSGGERALDALMKSIREVKFRPDAERRFILITDEYVQGTYSPAEVLIAAKRANITIDVLGRDEPFQRTIAEQTGGIWASIEGFK